MVASVPASDGRQRLVGRDWELALLSRWIDELAAGRGRAALVEGEPGIGKTALLRAAWERAAQAGLPAFWGAGEELGQAFPLLPLLDAFAIRASSADPGRAELLRQLHSVHTGPGTGVTAAAELLIELVDDTCASTPAVLVIDDLHWADAATIAVWHRLSRTCAQRALLLLGAARPLPHRDDLQALRPSLPADHVLRLGPLPPAAVTDLVAALAGAAPGPALARAAEEAGGNPLYLAELIDALDRAGRLAIDNGLAHATAGPAPATLTEAINDRLNFLPAPARRILQAAALLGDGCTAKELSLVLGAPPADLAPALADAHTAGVLAEADGQLAFRHPLIRATLYDSMPADVRAAWHRDAAHALRQADAPPARVARQLLPTLDDHHPATEGWIADWLADTAPILVGEAAQPAVRLLRHTAAHLPLDDRRRHRLAAHLAQALVRQADHDAAEQLIAQTLPHVADPDVLVDLHGTLAGSRTVTQSRLGETLAGIQRALVDGPALTPEQRNRLELATAGLHNVLGNIHQAERIARGALANANPPILAHAASLLGTILGRRGDTRASMEVLDQGLAATAGRADLTDRRIQLLLHRAESQKHLDQLAGARAALADAANLAERSGGRRRLISVQASLCELHFFAGSWDDALAEATLPDDVDAVGDRGLAHGVAAAINYHRGDIRAASEQARAGRLFWARASIIMLAGVATLAEALSRETANDPAGALRAFRDRLALHAAPVETELWLADAVRLALHRDDQETARDAAARAQAAADDPAPHRTAAAQHCRGLLAADPDLLLAAADSYQHAGRPLPQAQALEAAAALLAERADRADWAGAARPPFAAAFDIYAALGADWDITRLRARFRRHGLQGPRARQRATTGWASLTATEAKVAALIAQGQTNRAIADALAISRHTVGTHVARILAKLHLRSRFEIIHAAATTTQATTPAPDPTAS
jgi:DNA-binding CsgD family transcriptional regulator